MQTLNRLWVDASGERFGFSVQHDTTLMG
nr:hypothetical protein [Leptolyngbya sp. FACHB-60]